LNNNIGIVIEFFESKYICVGHDALYFDDLEYIVSNYFSELTFEKWCVIETSKYIAFLRQRTIELLTKANSTFMPSINSDLEIEFEGKNYLINLRSDEGRRAKFILRLYYIFQASYHVKLEVRLKLMNEETLFTYIKK